jgi:hypothetical protein
MPNNYCSNCGDELQRNSKFCSSCGTRIELKKVEPKIVKEENLELKLTETTRYDIKSDKEQINETHIGVAAGVVVAILIIALAVNIGTRNSNNNSSGSELESQSVSSTFTGQRVQEKNNPKSYYWPGATKEFCDSIHAGWNDGLGQCRADYVTSQESAGGVNNAYEIQHLMRAQEALGICLATYPQTGYLHPGGKCDAEWADELAAENSLKK